MDFLPADLQDKEAVRLIHILFFSTAKDEKKYSSEKTPIDYFELEEGMFSLPQIKKNKIINFQVCNFILFIIYYKVTGIFLWDEN